MNQDDIRIGNNHLICSSIDKHDYKIDSDAITCYASIERNGRNYTKYFSPDNAEFQKSIHLNLLRKYKLLNPDKNISELLSEKFIITPVGNVKERISMFEKGGLFPVKGWWGKFKLEGNREILQTAVNCGLGSKNSAGWGCITLERR